MAWTPRTSAPRVPPRRALVAALLAAVWTLVAAPAPAGPRVPDSPPGRVVDLAGVIDSATAARTEALLRELEERTSAQVVVLTLPSLEGEALEAFSVDLAHNRWKLGQKGKDNGVLVTVAVRERVYRIEVGYGLEGLLPDSVVGSLGRQVLVPAFRAGDYAGGLAALSWELAARIAQASGVTLSGAPPTLPGRASRQDRAPGKPGPLATALALLLVPVFLYLLIRHPQLLIWLLLSSRGGSRGSWGGGGGGFGGGGGGFGGGGSSGSW